MALPSTDDIDMNKTFKCIIVGAGIAGLSAAKHLIKNNIKDFVILEAKDKIGGRILSSNIGKNKVELGANWIHGVLGNPMYEIAMSHGLIDIVNVVKPHNVVAATEDGKQVPFPVLREIYGAYMCFLRRCEEYFLCQYLPPDGIQSVGEHINLEIALYLDRIKDIKEKHLRQLIFCCLLKRETCISGCNSMNDVDLLELGSFTELQGGNIVLPSGYSSILEPVAHDIPEKSILLKHKVSKILWPGQTNQSESSSESDGSVNTVIEYGKKTTTDLVGTQVLCENGLSLKADCVICSLPLGVLKENGSKLFVPPLPDCKMESIERLLFGTVDKIFLIYDRPFLNPDISEVLLLWENKNEQNKDDLSNSWYRKIYSFSKVTDTLLLGWVSGDEAIYMESLSDDVIAETCTKILKKFLNDPFVPKPKYTICSRWYSDPCFRGSYTTLAVGSSQADIECVAETMYSAIQPNKPVLLFAGEHTHNSFYSTVHGAYLSGRAAAQSIIKSEVDTSKNEVVLECKDTSDLSSWIRSVSLE